MRIGVTKKLETIYHLELLRSVLWASFVIFFPVILFQKCGLGCSLLFLMLSYSIFPIFSPFLAWYISRRKVLFSYFLYFLLMFIAVIASPLVKKNTLMVLFFIPFLTGISLSLYYLPFHTSLAKYGKEKITKNVSFLLLISTCINTFFPVLTAIFIKVYGIMGFYIFLTSFIFFFALFLSTKYKSYLSEKIIFEIKMPKKRHSLFILEGAVWSIPRILPIFVYQLTGSVMKTGIIFSAASLLSSVISYLILPFLKLEKNRIIRTISFSLSYPESFLMISNSPFICNLNYLISRCVRCFFWPIYFGSICLRSKEDKTLSNTFFWRELFGRFGELFIYIVGLITLSFRWMFTIAILANFLGSIVMYNTFAKESMMKD